MQVRLLAGQALPLDTAEISLCCSFCAELGKDLTVRHKKVAGEFCAVGTVVAAVTASLAGAVRAAAVAWSTGDMAEVLHLDIGRSSNRWRSKPGECGVDIPRRCGRECRNLDRKVSCHKVCCGKTDAARGHANVVLWCPVPGAVMVVRRWEVLAEESLPCSWRL